MHDFSNVTKKYFDPSAASQTLGLHKGFIHQVAEPDNKTQVMSRCLRFFLFVSFCYDIFHSFFLFSFFLIWPDLKQYTSVGEILKTRKQETHYLLELSGAAG